ncbi:MBL fold metallo-hydrolase [Amphritea atlantica]|uniref:MBL fold metallo-hydrolase n=1 Tax=Amphritea atlantica TaxID=355243 RepID=A0ABY5GQT5_9GAMM|nr:MBL fold metallo-hydrolase [Amphritea atlantica]
MIFHQLATQRGCQSYLIGCSHQRSAIIIDPELSMQDNYRALLNKEGLRLHYLLDTHTHADHFSASQTLARQLQVPVIMHRNSPAPFVTFHVDDGEMIRLGELKLEIIHTPGHTEDSICILIADRVLTGDTLLLGGTGRSDLPGGDPAKLYNSLFNKLLLLPPETQVYPAHIYSDKKYTTIASELLNNRRLQITGRSAFIKQMNTLNLDMPDHLTEALRTNLSGGKTVASLLAEAAEKVPFMSLREVALKLKTEPQAILLLDVRETDQFRRGHIPGAINIPRGQLELQVNSQLTNPTQRIVTYCQFGKISTLAAATLKELGFDRAVALDGGYNGWLEMDYPVEPAGHNDEV